MKRSVEITYSHPGTQPPVYLAASFTEPAWTPIEMEISSQRTKDGELLFLKKFEEVEQGRYQYKFRLGPGDWWVLDENAPTVTDASGNKNNLLAVEPIPLQGQEKVSPMPDLTHNNDQLDSPSPITKKHSGTFEAPSPVLPAVLASVTNDSTNSPPALVPFTVVEHCPDQERPVYGDLEAASLHEDTNKRTADADPDIEYGSTKTQDQPLTHGATQKEDVPALIVEKTDSAPSFGDDFGPGATATQKEAHQKRLADAEADQVVVRPEEKKAPSLASQNPAFAAALGLDSTPDPTPTYEKVPLFAHETLPDDLDDDFAPLLPHESSSSESPGETRTSPLLETRSGAVDNGTPLFTHELGSFLGSPSRSRTSLSTMSFEDEDVEDPSLERFPTNREDILKQIESSERRMSMNETLDVNRSPSRSPVLRSIGSSVSLQPIQESEDDEEHHAESAKSATGVDFSGITYRDNGKGDAPGATHAKKDSKMDNTVEEDTQSTPLQPLTPPMTPPVQSAKAKQSADTRKEEPESLLRQRQATSSPQDRAVTPADVSTSMKKQKSIFAVLWSFIFGRMLGPIGHFIVGLFDGRRNAP